MLVHVFYAVPARPGLLTFNCHWRWCNQVSGLLLSTPVETVPILVTYSAVSGGIFFHAPPLDTPSASPRSREQYNGQPETTGTTATSGRTPDSPAEEEEDEEEDEAGDKAAAQLEEEVAVAYLENAFPGKLAVAPVSLRSTATWEGRVEGMESSGSLVRATLTRTDVPGLAAASETERAAGGGEYSAGATADAGVVQVRECAFGK